MKEISIAFMDGTGTVTKAKSCYKEANINCFTLTLEGGAVVYIPINNVKSLSIKEGEGGKE